MLLFRFVFLFLFFFFTQFSFFQRDIINDSEVLLNVPGLRYRVISSFLPRPQSINILEVDPTKYRVELVSGGIDKVGCDTVSSIVKRVNGIAGINGGLFLYKYHDSRFADLPVQILKIGNKWFSDPKKFCNTSVGLIGIIGWNNGGIEVDLVNMSMKWELKIGKNIYPINRINKPRGKNRSILYFPTMGETTLSSKNGIEIIVRKNKIFSIEKNIGNARIPKDGFVYSVGDWLKLDLSNIKVGMPASFNYEFLSSPISTVKKQVEKPIVICEQFSESLPAIPGLPFSPVENLKFRVDFDLNLTTSNNVIVKKLVDKEYFLGGFPILLSKGEIPQNFDDANIESTLLLQRHPRTAVGIKSNGTWVFVVVDGRQSLFSVGMTMNELAYFMKSLGCVEALNLDGGGSSTFFYMGKVCNNPSGDDWSLFKKAEIIERPVSDALVILPRD